MSNNEHILLYLVNLFCLMHRLNGFFMNRWIDFNISQTINYKIQPKPLTVRALPYHSTSFTTAAYGSHQNVFIRLDPLGRPPSANSGSYATIASLNKYSLSDSKKSCTYAR